VSDDLGPADMVRLALMATTDLVAPLHEWLAGEFAYFVDQGYTFEQARAMAAAEFMTAMGGRIESGASRPDDDT
jgi:hypothetical protein